MNWMFIDMNSYFASVEQHLRPELRGRMVGVIPVESDNTSIIAASQSAKKFGVKTGTPVHEARRLCPELLFVKARPSVYVQVHHSILRSVETCCPVHKVYSIDEWAIRLMGDERNPPRAMALGQTIKRRLLQDFSPCLTCSIGIAPTRLLAKIASDLKKPDGLTILGVEDLPDRLDEWSLRDLCGIGGGVAARLHAQGIQTVRQLWNLSKQRAIHIWGSVSGGYWWNGFHGCDEPEIPTRRRSMSHANVLDPQFRNPRGAHGILVRLLCRLGTRLRNDGYFAQCLRVQMKYVRGGGWSDAAILPGVQDTPTLLRKFEQLWRRRAVADAPPIQVGVEVGDLVPAAQVSRSLFDEIEKPLRISHAIDIINRRWGNSMVYFGAMHDFRHQMDEKIAFGRIPPMA